MEDYAALVADFAARGARPGRAAEA
jgi:hypothetical protein